MHCDRTLTAGQAQRGFAYLWVMMLVFITGLGLTTAAEIHHTEIRRDKEAELLAIGRQFRQAIGAYYEANAAHVYPASLEDLLQDRRFPGASRHLRRLFVDPMTSRPEWGIVRVGGRIVGVHSLSSEKPIKQDRFEPGNESFRQRAKYSDWVFTYPSDLALDKEFLGGSASRNESGVSGLSSPPPKSQDKGMATAAAPGDSKFP